MSTNLPNKVCENESCQRVFDPKRSWQRFCSVNCRLSSFSTTKLMRLKPIFTCPHCGKQTKLKENK